MRLIRIFIVFCRLKREEIWGGLQELWEEEKEVIIAIPSIVALFILSLIVKVVGYIIGGIIAIFLIFGLGWLIVEFIKWLRSNWQKATKIVEDEK